MFHKSLVNNARSICFSLDGDTLFIGNDNANNYVANPVAVGMVTRKGGFKDLKSYIPSEKLAQPHINGIAVNPVDGSLLLIIGDAMCFAIIKLLRLVNM